jgi:hypothetical protein
MNCLSIVDLVQMLNSEDEPIEFENMAERDWEGE